MSRFRVIALLIAVIGIAAILPATSASACPGGYVACGPGCCPGR